MGSPSVTRGPNGSCCGTYPYQTSPYQAYSAAMMRSGLVKLAVPVVVIGLSLAVPATVAAAAPAAAQAGPGVGSVPQGVQSNASYAASYAAAKVTNVDVTSGQVSCYRPEDPFFANDGPNDGYTGESACPGATTGENTGASGPYPTQA